MPHPKFDRHQLHFKKLAERKNKVEIIRDCITPEQKPVHLSESDWDLIKKTVARIRLARNNKSSVILAFGAHTIKNGLAPILIRLLEQGWITHMATNGAGIIHDWEFAFQGKSSEDVKENVNAGQFGIWEETGFYINLAMCVGAFENLGYGESIGKMIVREGLDIPDYEVLKLHVINYLDSDPAHAAAAADLYGVMQEFHLSPGLMKIPHPFKKYSVQAAAYNLGVPFTGHPMIGHDIIYTHPLNNGAAVGRTAMTDFLSYADSVSRLDNGVYISLGSAVMSPMIFEKSLSMAQNARVSMNSHIDDHYMLVVDLAKSDWDWKKNGEPPAGNPAYYMRYCKTFSRMGGEMDYLTADNRDFLLALYQTLNE
ncbi:MAG TPA: hypothetical protein VK207_04775 [Bacteroidales bacterium]|nr:hypothetical protein [Bacteroidales bacterium]